MNSPIWLTLLLTITNLSHAASSTDDDNYISCLEVSTELRFPCLCALGPIETALDGNPSISVNCDRTVFPGDFPVIPYGAPIVSFSQRWVGHQSLPTQALATYGLPLRTIDFSGNSLRRLTERVLQGLQSSLVELKLADNLLGDTLNPIFSTSEFHGLSHLQLLDLSGNRIKAIEEGILEGCENLQELLLDRNSFTTIPTASLNGPKSLKFLSLTHNKIDVIKSTTFESQVSLETINLNNNFISLIEGGSFDNLEHLKFMYLGHNKLSKFNSDVFQGAFNLQKLDLSENFIKELPAVALKTLTNLRYLNLSSNLIQNIDGNSLSAFVNLYQMDLSRNNIANIVPGSFLGLRQLRRLDLSVNSLRTVEDDAFEGLDNLETLNLKDNNILLVPASALGRLPRLTSLQLDYNRVAALSGDILRSIAQQIQTLTIARNVVRELPPKTFEEFERLENLDLSGNLLSSLSEETFYGLEKTLLSLKVSQNVVNNIGEGALVFHNLKELDLSVNQLNRLERNVFRAVEGLEVLNVSYNPHLTALPIDLIHKTLQLKVIDLSFCNLQVLSPNFFSRSSKIVKIVLGNNALSEIPEAALANLRNLTTLDLSENRINNIRIAAFVNVMNIKTLDLHGNELTSFKGEHFNTGTSLEVLNLSNNLISYLFPSSFRIHPRLRRIDLSNNKLYFFPADVIANLQFLESINLSGNELKTIDELDFARLPNLRSLFISHNQINSISEMAFHNSTQLQILDFSSNKLDRLGERTFEGLIRIELLDLENNSFSELPDTIFERTKLHMLENINLAHNLFVNAPLKALQRQYFFITSVDLSFNNITDIPADNSVLVNIKKLDLSSNPLTNEAIKNILEEPKTVRELNLANTGIVTINHLELPFLHTLNLSHNKITQLTENSFERTTLLQTLDLSHNNLTAFTKIWPLLRHLQTLNVSHNPIATISQEDFDGLNALQYFSMQNLFECNRIEKTAFKHFQNLARLDAYGYPKIGYLDVQGLLQQIPTLESLNIEIKDAAVGSDQLQAVLHPRLRELSIHGSRLRSVSSGSLSGLKAPCLTIRLRNTSLTNLPPALFFPIPRSSKVVLDITGNQLTSLNPQMISAIEDRKGDLKVVGLATNPILCDCSARALKRWLQTQTAVTIKCAAPPFLFNQTLNEIQDDRLTCDARSVTTTQSSTITAARTTRLVTKTTEAEIIWSLPTKTTKKPSAVQAINNDDTLIIAIVGGVVAFIAILIIIICIIRLKMTSNSASAVAAMPATTTGSNCAWSVKGGTTLYAVPPAAPGYCATLPHKAQNASSVRNIYSTVARTPTYNQPYFIAYSTVDDKIYR